MNVRKMRYGCCYYDYDGDGRFAKTKAFGKALKRYARKYWIKQQKLKMDE